jgi:hypothetical protein
VEDHVHHGEFSLIGCHLIKDRCDEVRERVQMAKPTPGVLCRRVGVTLNQIARVEAVIEGLKQLVTFFELLATVTEGKANPS